MPRFITVYLSIKLFIVITIAKIFTLKQLLLKSQVLIYKHNFKNQKYKLHDIMR